ncbi:MAG: bifunctional oligoribonuclease/PAP phosphatase NrnA [Patescibacteria group bacterium]
MQDFISLYRDFQKLLEKSNKILLLCHRRPDGDTLGAATALFEALQNMGKAPTMACVDTPTERFSFLPNIRKLVKEFDYKTFDLIIVSDAGAHYMTQYHEIYPGIFSGEHVPVSNIDHHASNDYFGTLNIVDPVAASATVILHRIFSFLKIKITPNIATALLAGIYNDTGSFMHSNTTQEVFEIAADLTRKGGKVYPISQNMFKTATPASLRLWGKALENMTVTKKGAAVSVLTLGDFDDSGADLEDSGGVIDLLNAVPGIRFSMLLTEDRKGFIKGSLRTQRDDVDLSAMAGTFGGGGHKKASGFTVKGRIEREMQWKIVSETGENVAEKLLSL